MPADTPTILATSGGLRRGSHTEVDFAPLIHYGLELAGVAGRRPRLCLVGTAGGDQAHWIALFHGAGQAAGIEVSHLNLFPMPNVADVSGFLAQSDLIWVGGGSVANLLALWRLHGLDEVFRRLWRDGVVLAGVSAGSLCWHVGGTTDSFGPNLRPVTNGLAFLPYSNGVHYDSEPQRRPLFQALVADGTLPGGYATDDGVGLVYRGTDMVEAVSEIPGKAAYRVVKTDSGFEEQRLDTRLLPGSR